MIKLPVDYTTLDWQDRKLVREQYVKEQGGDCWHCHEPLVNDPPKSITDLPLNLALFPDKFLRHPIHLQHDHTTGMTEGAVHAYCNAVLWQYYGR
jgi:hypothetical protein